MPRWLTPLERPMVATRSGSIEPGLVPWLARACPPARDGADRTLEHNSDLLAPAERRTHARCGAVARPARSGSPGRRGLPAPAAGRDRGDGCRPRRLDALPFAGGVGERSALVREEACQGLEFLGVAIGVAADAQATADREVGGGVGAAGSGNRRSRGSRDRPPRTGGSDLTARWRRRPQAVMTETGPWSSPVVARGDDRDVRRREKSTSAVRHRPQPSLRACAASCPRHS